MLRKQDMNDHTPKSYTQTHTTIKHEENKKQNVPKMIHVICDLFHVFKKPAKIYTATSCNRRNSNTEPSSVE